MKRFLPFAIIALMAVVVYSCSKDQRTVRWLSDGEWEVTAQSVDGVSQPDSAFANTIYTFEKCRVRNNDCEGSLKSGDPTKGEVSYPFTYSISDKGEKITINLDVFGFVTTTTYDILENSKEKFTWSGADEDGIVTETTIEKK